MKKLRTKKFQQYHASVWIKTEEFTPQVEIKVLDGKGRNVCYTYLNARPTQDWTEHHVTFNSLDNDQLNLYIGVWGPKTGKLWLRDARLESTGAVNLVRRDTAPIQVQLVKGSERIDLKEGDDFEKWQDPKLGQVPYAGEFEPWHQPPPILCKRPLPDGSLLEVSYFHTHVIHESQVCGCISDKGFEKLLADQIASVSKLIPTNSIMMSHDEYRVMGWTIPSIPGLAKETSPGDMLTHNAQFCFETIRRANSNARVLTWSDMFDPFHNAVPHYYLVNGSLESARLPKDVWVMNWNSDKMKESLKHFENLGHRQIIAGYYDQPPAEISRWLDAVVDSQVKHVEGVMYTTWAQNYQHMEAFADHIKKHKWYQMR